MFHASVDMKRLRFSLKPFQKSVAKSADTLHFLVHFQAAQSVGFAHTDDLGVWRVCLSACLFRDRRVMMASIRARGLRRT